MLVIRQALHGAQAMFTSGGIITDMENLIYSN